MININIKDILYFCGYFISILSVFFAFKHRLQTLENKLNNIDKIIFADRGILNLVDQRTCKVYRDQIFEAIRKSNELMSETGRKLETVNENVIRIMEHLKIEKNSNKM